MSPATSVQQGTRLVQVLASLVARGYLVEVPWVSYVDEIPCFTLWLCAKKIGTSGFAALSLRQDLRDGIITACPETSMGPGIRESGDACTMVDNLLAEPPPEIP